MRTNFQRLHVILAAYYVYVFTYDFIFGYALYTGYLYLQGLSPGVIGGLLAFWAGAAMVLEVPSGALADRYDRRVLLVLAPLIKAGCFITWALAPAEVVWPYALGFFLWAAGSALQSGTREALLYEYLRTAHVTRWYETILGRETAVRITGITLGGVLGGFIGHVSMPLAFWLCLPTLAVCAIAALFLPDIRPSRGNSPILALSWAGHIRGAVAAFKDSAHVRFIALYIAMGMGVFGSLEEFDQLFYQATRLPVWVWGLVGGVASLLHMGASLYAGKFRAWRGAFWAPFVVSGVCLLVCGAMGSTPWAALPLILAYVVVAPAQVLSTARFQRALEGPSRATATSALALCAEGMAMVYMGGFGLLASAIGILPAYQAVGVFVILFALWVLWAQRKEYRL